MNLADSPLFWMAAVVAAYLVGSIPIGVIMGRMRGIDIRAHGSRNVGATNVWRVLGKRAGITCFFLDALKGAVPVLAAGSLAELLTRPFAELDHAAMWGWLSVAAAAIIGHMYSIFLRFGGGKGVATGFGAMLGLWPFFTIPALTALVIWGITLRAFRYVSVASMVAAASLPLTCILWNGWLGRDTMTFSQAAVHAWPTTAVASLLLIFVIWKHRANLARLRAGTEPRIGRRSGMRSS